MKTSAVHLDFIEKVIGEYRQDGFIVKDKHDGQQSRGVGFLKSTYFGSPMSKGECCLLLCIVYMAGRKQKRTSIEQYLEKKPNPETFAGIEIYVARNNEGPGAKELAEDLTAKLAPKCARVLKTINSL